MIDVVIRGGDVVDGTGARRRRADVGIHDGRIVSIADRVAEDAGRTIDAGGLVVAPGFVDVHTHLDVQGFWDPTLSPLPLHGVTTVFAGNCGFSVAAIAEESADYVLRMLARVEGMPLTALQQGVPWDWHTTDEYLERLEHRLAVNAGFMVGHSVLRRLVMGEAATQRQAEPAELEAMAELLRQGVRAGAVGFSTSWGFAHRDATGAPVPSNHARPEELVYLAGVCGEFPGTSIEFIPPSPSVRFDDRVVGVMVAMSASAKRPLNWNL